LTNVKLTSTTLFSCSSLLAPAASCSLPQHSCIFKSSPWAQRWHHPLKIHYVIPFGTLLIAPPYSTLVLLALIKAEALLAVCFIGGDVTGVYFILACCIHVCVLHHWKLTLCARRVAGNLKAFWLVKSIYMTVKRVITTVDSEYSESYGVYHVTAVRDPADWFWS